MVEFQKQLEIMTTCMLWYCILSDDRYLQQRRFTLCIENVRNRDEDGVIGLWNVEKIQRYRSFRILNDLFEQKTECLEAVRGFLSRREVRLNVEELHLMFHRFSLVDLFGSSHVWHFPKLQMIIDNNTTIIRSDDNVVINAPNIKHLKLITPQLRVSSLVQMFNDKIEKLGLCFLDIEIFYKTIQNRTLANLHSLTLITGFLPRLDQLELFTYDNNPRRIFAQLKYLKICDDYGTFYSLYEGIFRHSKKLETLIIISPAISEAAFNTVSEIKQLKELYLLVKIDGYYEVGGLCLPHLEKLTTFVGAFAPLRSVPKMESLCIKHPDWAVNKIEDVNQESLRKSLQVINLRLKILHLIKVDVNDRLFEAIRGFRNLRSLKMRLVTIVSIFIY